MTDEQHPNSPEPEDWMYERRHAKRARRRRSLTIWLPIIFAGVIGFAGLANFGAALVQWNTMQQQLERGWIVPRNMMLEETLVKNQPAKFKLLFDNPGTTPAIDEFQQSVPMLVLRTAVDGEPLRKYIADADICQKTEPSKDGRVVYPSTNPNHAYEYRMTYPAEFIGDEFMTGKQVLLVVGCFKYRTLGEVHHSAYCFVGHAGLKVNEGFAICPFGNHAD